MGIFRKLLPRSIVNLFELPHQVREIEKRNNKLIPRSILKFEVHLAEHCNLNCRGCDNFSPIAQKEFLDPVIFHRDFSRLSQLCNKEAHTIHLMGGEPLLHPQLKEILSSVREYFPVATINLFTNGILLLKQDDEFWEICRKNQIHILVTKYPVNFDYDGAQKLAAEKQVVYKYAYSVDEKKALFHFTLDLEGQQNEVDSFLKCHRGNDCVSLWDGKIYTCSMIPNIRHFNRQFGKQLPVSDRDFIDIFQVESLEEILRFVSRPAPFCRYCKIDGDTALYDWKQSEKSIEEWT